ncbi:hypothetical protein LIER_14836 [Lithospermum erythrorhizon]|uniref:Uncharacterized protein n=1 Tax=Lithospermum erythrorhizon TaxID=34254 RepID=A0AAV3Q1J0_LITER
MLSKIGSYIVIPIMADSATSALERMFQANRRPVNRVGNRREWRVVVKESSQRLGSHVHGGQVHIYVPDVVPIPLCDKVEPLVIDNEAMGKLRLGKVVVSPIGHLITDLVEDPIVDTIVPRSVSSPFSEVVLKTNNAFAELEKVEPHGVDCEVMENSETVKAQCESVESPCNLSKQCVNGSRQQLKKLASQSKRSNRLQGIPPPKISK